MKKVYFASPLFSEMEIQYNQQVVNELRLKFTNLDIYLPQEQGDINNKESYADAMMIAKADTDALLASDLLIAVLDGLVVDPGVASEIGVAYQAGIPIIGIYSDSRTQGATNKQKIEALKNIAESQFSYINLYTVGLIKLRGEVITSSKELMEVIPNYI